jgi:glycosyltransferase involved in cell wall biosynthesis
VIAARARLGLWASSTHERRVEAWRQMRTVLRSHTADGALALMLRAAGLSVQVPRARYAVMTAVLGRVEAEAVLRQSVRPEAVLTTAEPDDLARARLDARGVRVLSAGDQPGGPAPWQWVGLLDTRAPRTWFEDLLTVATLPVDVRRIVPDPSPATEAYALARLVDGVEWTADTVGLVRADLVVNGDVAGALSATHSGTVALAVVGHAQAEPPAELEAGRPGPRARVTRSGRRLLVAGHDLKFIAGVVPELERAGWTVGHDVWANHTDHDSARSKELLSEADVVLCEWGLGNAVWYSQHLGRHQAMVTRVHMQELRRPFLSRIAQGPGRRFVFVNEVVRRAAITGHGIRDESSVVIPNFVDVEALNRTKSPGASKRIGFVGAVPRMKRLDVALDVLELVRSRDEEFTLAVRGKMPSDYPWMKNRSDELAFYGRQFARIDELNADAPGTVRLDGYGDDMAAWYREVGHVISVSDFESFHLTIADGAASGAVPHVLYWPGAELTYPRSWSHRTVEELAEAILATPPERGVLQAPVRDFSVERVAGDLLRELDLAVMEAWNA